MINKNTDQRLTGEINQAFQRITQSFTAGRGEVSGDLFELTKSDIEGRLKFKFADKEYIIKTTKYILEEAFKFETFEKINNYPKGEDTYKKVDDLTMMFKPDPKKLDLFIMAFLNEEGKNSSSVAVGSAYVTAFITWLGDKEAEIVGPYFVDVSDM